MPSRKIWMSIPPGLPLSAQACPSLFPDPFDLIFYQLHSSFFYSLIPVSEQKHGNGKHHQFAEKFSAKINVHP
jgi:hypothetical protein